MVRKNNPVYSAGTLPERHSAKHDESSALENPYGSKNQAASGKKA